MPLKIQATLLILIFVLFSCKKKDNVVPTPIPPATTNISSFAIASKYIGDVNFLIPAPISNNPGSFTYASDNPAVATIKGDSIQIKGVGTANITVTQKASDKYNSGTAKTSFSVLPNIYIAGHSYTQNGEKGVYWKNGVINSLEGSGMANDIFIQGKDIYIAAGMDNVGPYYVPGYWKNGKQYLLSKEAGDASAIAVLGNDVYVVGLIVIYNPTTESIPTLWKNGAPVKLQNPLNCCGQTFQVTPTGITVHNNKVYICGTAGGFGTNSPIVWNGDGSVYKVLTEKSAVSVNQILFDGDDLYLCGSNSTNKTYLTYWKNDIPYSIVNTTANNTAYNTIAVVGNNVYTAGIDEADGGFNAAYWKNGLETVLAQKAIAYKMAANGNDIYVVGESISSYNYYDYDAVYWLNGTLIKLPSTHGTVATAISIVAH